MVFFSKGNCFHFEQCFLYSPLLVQKRHFSQMKKNPIYQIQNFDRNSNQRDLYVNTFKNHIEKHAFVEEPHRHNFYLLVLFTKGSGIHEIDFDRYTIKEGSLFLIQPGQIHHWQLSPDIEGYIIFYSQESYNLHFGNKKIEDYPFYQSVKNEPNLLLNPHELAEIRPYFDLLVLENQKDRSQKTDKLLDLLDIIHIEISRKYLSENTHAVPSYNHKIKKLESLLEHFYKTEKAPAFYASKMNMTLKHLNRICKSTLNLTATALITDRIILETKRLLSDKTKSIGQIADELGYIDYSYFGKLFKKKAGMTPTEFRKETQSKIGA